MFEEKPLLSINANTGAITVLRAMTDTEKASAQVFTVKAYDSVYNDLYDLATLTIYALSYGLTPYTPKTTYIAPMPIDEILWTENNVGIRRNNDYDSHTSGDLIPDSSVSTASAKEDDLIRVFVDIDETIPGLTYSVQRNSSYLKFWKSASKSGGEYDFTNNECTLSLDSDLWAEYTASGNSNYTLTLIVKESATGAVLATKSMIFRPFNSITCAFVGEFQDPGPDFSESGINQWVVMRLLEGYDVHVWDDGFDITGDEDCATDGSGRAFNEIKNAVNNRGVTELAIIGFSHGGGSVYNLSSYLNADLNSIVPEITGTYSIVFTSYIDAIQNTSQFSTDPVDLRPINSQFHLNQYQINGTFRSNLMQYQYLFYEWSSDFLDIHGAPTCGGTPENTNNVFRSALYHSEMDDSAEVRSCLTCYFHNKVQR